MSAAKESFQDALAETHRRAYAFLRTVDPDLYRTSIQAAEAVVLNHRLTDGHGKGAQLAADIEAAVICQVAIALGWPGR